MSRRAPLPPPEFFIDRSLGRRHLAKALTECGLVAHTLSSVYGEERAQSVGDTEWLALAGERGWVVLMKDDRIRRRPAEIEALRVADVRAFCLTNANLRAVAQSERFVANRHRIIQRGAKPGPFIDGVYANGLRRLWPRAGERQSELPRSGGLAEVNVVTAPDPARRGAGPRRHWPPSFC